MANMQLPLPTDLRHQPVLAFPYFDHDPYCPGDTDAQFVSLGFAQWNPRDISVKIMRHVEKWSRQSEELPPARAVDAVTVIALAMLNSENPTVTLPMGFFENQPNEMVVKWAPSARAFLDLLRKDDVLRRRLDRLTDTLIELRAAEERDAGSA